MDLTRLAHSHVSVGKILPQETSSVTRIDKVDSAWDDLCRSGNG